MEDFSGKRVFPKLTRSADTFSKTADFVHFVMPALRRHYKMDKVESKEQCQQLYDLTSTDLFEATDFLFSLYLRLPMEIRNTKVKIVKREEGGGK